MHFVSFQVYSMNLKLSRSVRQLQCIRCFRNFLNAKLACCCTDDVQSAVLMAGHVVLHAIDKYGILLAVLSKVNAEHLSTSNFARLWLLLW